MIKHGIRWLLTIVVYCLIIIILNNKSLILSFTYNKDIDQYNYTEFYNLSQHYHDELRDERLLNIIQQIKGVYHNKSKSIDMNLQNTILTVVLSYNEIHTKHYKVYFKNFLCFIQHYQLDLLVYLVHHNIVNLEQEIYELEHYLMDDHQSNVMIMSYPDALYYHLLATGKINHMSKGKGKADYLYGDIPSFTHHGALVMLVPVLEVLQLGYNVIFFDVDTGFVLDPIPYMIQGSADLVVSVETRHCSDTYPIPPPPSSSSSSDVMRNHYHDHENDAISSSTTVIHNNNSSRDRDMKDSQIENFKKKKMMNKMMKGERGNDNLVYNTVDVEPNTGVMMIRATIPGVRFYKQWLHRIIQANIMNDQKVMKFKALHAIYTSDCFYPNHPNTAAAMYSNNINTAAMYSNNINTENSNNINTENSNNINTENSNNIKTHHHQQEDLGYRNATYCFLSELLFQNGETAFRCAIKPAYRDNYVLGMYKHGLVNFPPHSQLLTQSPLTQQKETSAMTIVQSSISSLPLTSNHIEMISGPHYHSRYPVLIHANYCDKKSHELAVRGLWLLNSTSSTDTSYNNNVMHNTNYYSVNESSYTQHSLKMKNSHLICMDYKIELTEYHSLNWTREALKIYKKRRYMYKTFVKNNTLIRSSNSRTIYLITENKTKRIIPDMLTFLYMQGETRLGEIKTLPSEVVDMIPLHDIPEYPAVKEILVPPWMNETIALNMYHGNDNNSNVNNDVIHANDHIKYVYRRINLFNGTLMRLDDRVASSRSQQLIYMLAITDDDTVHRSNPTDTTKIIQKRQICDRESFITHFSETHWETIVPVPSYIVHTLSDGLPLMSINYRYNCTHKISIDEERHD